MAGIGLLVSVLLPSLQTETPPLSPAERHRIPYLQMFQERLRQQQQQGVAPPRGEAQVPGASPPPGLKLRMPQVGMGPRAPRPRVQTPGTPEQFDPTMRPPMAQQQHQHLRASLPPQQQQQRARMMQPRHPLPQQQAMPPRAPVRPIGPDVPSAGHPKGGEDDQLEDLLSKS